MVTGWTTQRWCAALVAVGAATVLVTSCSDDDPPKPPVTSSAVSTPAVTPPAVPDPEFTPHGAETFTRYFWDVYNYSYETVDDRPIAAISQSACIYCKSTTDELKKLRSKGSHVEGLKVIVDLALAPPVKDPTRIVVVAVIHQEPGRSIDQAGAVDQIEGVGKSRVSVALEWMGSDWAVHGVSIDTPKKAS